MKGKDIRKGDKVKVIAIRNLADPYFGEVCVVTWVADKGYLVWSRRASAHIFYWKDEVKKWF